MTFLAQHDWAICEQLQQTPVSVYAACASLVAEPSRRDTQDILAFNCEICYLSRLSCVVK